MFLIQDTIVIDVKNEAQLCTADILFTKIMYQRKHSEENAVTFFSNRYSLNISVIRYLDIIKIR